LQIWPPLLSAAKERQDKLERAKKALDELEDTERDTKQALANLATELDQVKSSEKVGFLIVTG
jgi:F0F1-type ATP synthase membrane subunit b/b'